MSERLFPYQTQEVTAPRLGLIALQADETIEGDMRRLLPADAELLVSRVASDTEVTSETLAAMEADLTRAASLFPRGLKFDAIGYGCTSGTAQIGAARIAENIRAGTAAETVTQPLTALVAACEALGLRRLAVLSPYVAEVSDRLRHELSAQGVDTPVFGSFDVSTEAAVVRIDLPSILAASRDLITQANTRVDALFLSCTNLRALDAIAPLEADLGVPVLTSNQVMAWHMMHSTGIAPAPMAPGKLFKLQA